MAKYAEDLKKENEVLNRDIEETRESINRRLLPSGDIGRAIKKVKELSKESSEIKSELELIKKSVELIKEQIDAVLNGATSEKPKDKKR